MIIAICVAAVLLLLYILCLRGRKGNPELYGLRQWSYAHRGLHGEGRPENSLAAFRAAVDKGYGIELDVRLSADGTPVIMHDATLERTAGVKVAVADLTDQELLQYRLEGTEEHIPTFREVLNLVNGRVPLIVELKTAGKNAHKISAAVCQLLDTYDGDFCIESFDPLCVLWFKQIRPEIVRGQLAANVMKSKHLRSWLGKVILTYSLGLFLTKPDFIAYEFSGRKNLSNFLIRKLWGVQGVSWTLQNQKEYDKAVKEGWIPIFENFLP